jgi:hypothetical protein
MDEQFASPIGIIHHQSDDCAVGGVEHHQRQHVDVSGGKQTDQIMQPA